MRTPKSFYIKTYGCQMNELDSEVMAGILERRGLVRTQEEAAADLLMFNTCSIRDLAERKVMGKLGLLGRTQQKDRLIGVTGCMANAKKEKLFTKLPHIDFVVGTNNIHNLDEVLDQVLSGERQQLRTDPRFQHELDYVGAARKEGKTAFVSIIRGCNKFCTYCVVPYTRGPEVSRTPASIVEEVQRLADEGFKEITLLGQNVNSYGKNQNLCSFTELLAMINEIYGLLRIRFTTSHPKDLGTDLISGFKDIRKLCSHIHLPVQSGSNRILKRMNRNYTREQYLDKVAELRDTCPQIAITTDIIVGLPGETETDFEQTLQLVEMVEFDGLFAFQYSDRPPAPAVHLPDKISTSIISNRLQVILAFQDQLNRSKNQQLIGSTQWVLTDGLSKKEASGSPTGSDQSLQWTGRASTNKIVNFYVDESTANNLNLTGKVVGVHIDKGYSHSLSGRAVNLEPSERGLKGVENYAA